MIPLTGATINLEAMEGYHKAKSMHVVVTVATCPVCLPIPLKPYEGEIKFIFQCNMGNIVV